MTAEQEIEFIQTEIPKALRHLLGERPDAERIAGARRVVIDELNHVFGASAVPNHLDALASILMVDWAGIPENFDPKAILASVPIFVLDTFSEHLSGEVRGAASIIALERMRRHGDVLDWSFKRIDATHAKTTGRSSGSTRRKHGRAKVVGSEVMQIRALSGQMKQRDIAKLFGLNQKTVFDIIHRNTWRLP